MRKYKELSYTELKKSYNPKYYRFRTTKDVSDMEGIIGQERAVKAMEFGLKVKNNKYNIFIVGINGTGKSSYAHRVVAELAKDENIPYDWCYVYNFDDPSKPIVISIPAGMGKVLCEDMNDLIQDLLIEIPKTFNGEDYEKRKSEIIKEYQDEKNLLIDELTEYSKENGFLVKNTSTGFAFAPLIDGEVVNDEQYKQLDVELRNDIERRAEEIQNKASELIRKLKGIERKAKEKIIELGNTIGLFVVKPLIDELLGKYNQYERVTQYLQKVQNDIIDNIYDFDVDESEEIIVVKKTEERFTKKYKVNLFVDNSCVKGAPVISEFNPNYSNLVGKIEYENEQGNLRTDFTMIRSGAIQKANGGYLILQAREILQNLQSWETLKRALETGEVEIESLRGQLGLVDIASLRPEPIPVKLKVILIGNPHIYHLLYNYDEDFEELFKIKVDFDSEMEVTRENEERIIRFISSYCKRENLRHLDPTGIAKILEYNHRFSGSQKKYSTRFNKIIELLVEADTWAALDNSHIVTEKHIQKAFWEKINRNNKVEEKMDESYRNRKIILDVKDKKVGRINGLSIVDVGDHVFGKPTVISVTTSAGNNGIVNIEREVEMSGSIHDKGVLILEGYMNEEFAQNQPLTFNAKICFEQSYSGIDGDSASSTELYALLSSLSEIPLKQSIAVTGSVNQKGEIQPVGGVTEKVEGFYSVCKQYGFDGRQGVIIPHQNIDDLVLCEEITTAVKEGRFHIYPVKNINEGMEILTDKSIKLVFETVKEKLEHYLKCSKDKSKDDVKI